MLKNRLTTIAGTIFVCAAIFLLAACETALEPTGGYKAVPGGPGGDAVSSSGPGFGTPDSTYKGKRFDINKLPPPSTWNAMGHQHAFPDLFHFANGNKVVTLADWENRRKEISKIIQYYEYGVMPPIADQGQIGVADNAEDVIITWQDSSGGATAAITIQYKERSWTVTINTTLPAGANPANKYNPATGEGGYPLYFGGGGANWEGGTGNFPLSGTWASESDGTGNVPNLFGLNPADPSSPSANSSYAWGMSVILSVMEGIDLNNNGTIEDDECGFGRWYNPRKIGITGYSRNGKAAECIGALAESRGGRRVGHVGIGSAGSGGPSLERFISLAGYKVEGQYADPLPLNGPGLMDYNGLVGKPYYVQKVNNGDDIFPNMAGSAKWAPTPGGTSDNNRFILARGWSPYFDPYIATPTNGETGGAVPAPATNGITTPFIGWQTPANTWSGIQSLSEGRNETPGWFSVRFREFTDLHYGLDIDHVRGNEGRGKYGVLCTIPFDQHYLAALIAPNGVMFQDGYSQTRNNQEAQFANWVIIDEVYKFYGEQESNPEKYIFRNAFVMTWGDHGGNTGNETPDRNYHARAVFNGGTDNAATAAADPMLAKMRAAWFPVDDPVSRFDYYRMNWGRPGHPTIAERVQKRVEPIIGDYTTGEASRPFPTAGASPVHPSYTPTGPKFKPMDWHGLTDEPESL
jgi:hypothetical protein